MKLLQHCIRQNAVRIKHTECAESSCKIEIGALKTPQFTSLSVRRVVTQADTSILSFVCASSNTKQDYVKFNVRYCSIFRLLWGSWHTQCYCGAFLCSSLSCRVSLLPVVLPVVVAVATTGLITRCRQNGRLLNRLNV